MRKEGNTLDEILKEIIEIDKNAKNIIKEEMEKKLDIDNYIEAEYRTKKSVLDLEYKEEIEKQKQKYNQKYNEESLKAENEANREIKELEDIYNQRKNNIITSIIASIEN